MPPPHSEDEREEKSSLGIDVDVAKAEPGHSKLGDSVYGDTVPSIVRTGLVTEQGPYHEVLDAINSREASTVDAVLSTMDKEDVVLALTSEASGGAALIMCAARTGEAEVFAVVLESMESRLSHEQLRDTLTGTAERGEGSLLMAAAEGGNHTVFSQTVGLLHGEVLRATAKSWHRGHAVVLDAARSGVLETFQNVIDILCRRLSTDQAKRMITPQVAGDLSTFTAAMQGENRHIAEAWAEVLSATLSASEMTKVCTAALATCLEGNKMDGISVLLSYGAEVTAKDLINLAKANRDTPEQVKDCVLGSLLSVDNPFIPGMNLVVALEDAAKRAPEEEERALSALQEKLEDLLLEVLERLPQSIRIFPQGIDGCAAVFEPETVDKRDADFRGPLKLVFQEQVFTETICICPLVFECMSNAFVSGLPDVRDTNDLLGLANFGDGSSSTVKRSRQDSLLMGDMVATSRVGRLMQGLGLDSSRAMEPSGHLKRWDKLLGDSLLPGAQFILVGVVTRPMAYYKVPAVRMALDFVVHVFMLIVFTVVVLQEDDGDTSITEFILVFHVMAEIVNELRQMWANFQEYWENKWNWLESVSLLLLAGALFRRIGDTEGHTGLALFALSAPLVFSRLLFFGQILPRQGIVIQMITIMLGELLHFAVVMVIIMTGFTVAFFALFQNLEDYQYGDAWLDVFKAMLGEVGVFDELYGQEYGDVARFLLVSYLVIMAVLLLNLLIAILSTEHAKVEEVQERASRESKVRILKLYSRVVDKDYLPPPFNLIQLALTLPLSVIHNIFGFKADTKARRTIGGLVCWLVLGPCSILVVWALWVASAPSTVVSVWRGTTFSGKSLRFSVLSSSAVAIFHVLCLPFIILVLLWIKSGISGLTRLLKDTVPFWCGDGGRDDSTHEKPSGDRNPQGHNGSFISVALMLEEAPGGESVREIWAFLEKSTTTAGLVQRRGENVKAATVAHLKSTQSHMNAVSKEHSEAMLARLQSIDSAMKARLRESEERIRTHNVAILKASSREHVDVLKKSLREQVDTLEAKMIGVLERNVAELRRSLDR